MKARFILGCVLLLSLLAAGSLLLADEGDDGVFVCPLSQGYWANNAQRWPVVNVTLGLVTYAQGDLLSVLQSGGGGADASQILISQLTAAKLNIAAGADAEPINATIVEADRLLSQFTGPFPYNVAPSSPLGQSMLTLATILDAFNSSRFTPNCIQATVTFTPSFTPTWTPTVIGTPTPTSTPTLTPTPTMTMTPSPTMTGTLTVTPTATPTGQPVIIIIEGPVRAININIITIWDITVVVPPNNPLITQVRLGDVVRVEGVIGDGGITPVLVDDDDGWIIDRTNIVLVAINITIINVDVVVNVDGAVWRDPGNCSNPPPPWAPANGWRARCQGGGGNAGGGNSGGGGGGGGGGGDDDDD